MLEKKAEYKVRRKETSGIFAGKKREYAMRKRLAKYEKPKSFVGSRVSRLASSSFHKVMNADPDNGTLQAMEKAIDTAAKLGAGAVSTYKLLNKAEIKASAKLRDPARENSQKRLQKTKDKLNRQRINAQNTHSKQPKPKPKEKVSKKIGEFFKNIVSDGAGGKILAASMPVVLIVFSVVIIIYLLLNGISGMFRTGITWAAGTYPADDFSLAKAEMEYTSLAFYLNRDIINVGDSSKWKDTLVSKFGADKSKLKTKPSNWYWGKSTHFNWEPPEFDFDREKLWSFLCAYYAEFDAETGDAKLTQWTYSDDTKTVIKNLFDAEYKFVYSYDDNGYWEELSSYEYYPESENSWFFNDGCADRYAYSDCFDANSDCRLFSDSSRIYFDPSTFEILDIRETGDSSVSSLYGCNGYKRTGYFLVNQYDSNCDRCYYDYYGTCHDGYYGYGHTHTDSGEAWITNANDSYKYLVSGQDLNWEDHDLWAWQYFKKNTWKENIALFYNLKQSQTFDKAIEKILKLKDNGDERYAIYQMYAGDCEDAPDIHGGHQTFANILPGDSFYEEYVEKDKILSGYSWEVKTWNKWTTVNASGKNHIGIDIQVDKNTEIYAAFDGKITKIDAEKGLIEIKADRLKYFYESGESDDDVKGRDTKIMYYNIAAIEGLEKGTEVKAGELIGLSNGNIMCDNGKDNSDYVSDPYIHVQVYIDKDGLGWEYVDPIPLLGNKAEMTAETEIGSETDSGGEDE